MTLWRPAQHTVVKALGVCWRDRRVLCAEVCDDTGQVIGMRPLGGQVAFGERLEDRVVREFKEELGLQASILGGPVFFENIYRHEGAQGHEIITVFDVTLLPQALRYEDEIVFHESDGSAVMARWVDPDGCGAPDALPLFPDGLRTHLVQRLRATAELGLRDDTPPG